mmetsp:Transcript_24868/g.34756  ORF Transcript_24868/g.34756 Transcript_24868/m.34756 type:complete len:365 (-) Transcript_24868:219-1313(-)
MSMSAAAFAVFGRRCQVSTMFQHQRRLVMSQQFPIGSATAATSQALQSLRFQSTATKKKKNNKKKKGAAAEETQKSMSWYETKKAMKKIRSQRYDAQQDRKERLKTRQGSQVNRGTKKKEFDEWFNKRRVYQEIMERKARQAGKEWTLRVGVVLERLPVVTPDIPQWEEDYLDLRQLLDTYGKAYPKELGMDYYPEPGEVLTRKDMLEMLPEGFTPASRITEADRSGDVKTLDRRLNTRVYLTIKQKFQDKSRWTLPTVTVEEDETLLLAAQRAVRLVAGEKFELYCPSNCPMAMDMYVPPNPPQDGSFGIKTFYMRVQYDEGEVDESEQNMYQDYAWLDRSEMVERVLSERGVSTSKFYHYLL